MTSSEVNKDVQTTAGMIGRRLHLTEDQWKGAKDTGVTTGMLQGLVLGPVLFLEYVTDLSDGVDS